MKISSLNGIIAIGLLAIASCGTGTSSNTPPLLKVSAENLENLDQSEWSEVKEIDGRKARVIISHDTVSFTLAPWWGNAPGQRKARYLCWK